MKCSTVKIISLQVFLIKGFVFVFRCCQKCFISVFKFYIILYKKDINFAQWSNKNTTILTLFYQSLYDYNCYPKKSIFCLYKWNGFNSQDSMVLRIPTPPKESKPVSPRGKIHTTGPKMPASTKPKSKYQYFQILGYCIISQSPL